METLSRHLLTFLLNLSWQVPLIAAVAAIACRMLRRGPASYKHAVWVAALIAGMLLPLASVRSGADTPSMKITVSFPPQTATPDPAPRAQATRQAESASTAPAPHTVPFAQTTVYVLAAIYLLFLLYRLARLARAWIGTVRIRSRARAGTIPPLAGQVCRRCQEAFGLAGVELRVSSDIDTPVMLGAWRKTILLPESLAGETSEPVLTTAIGHEMAHIARQDFVLNLLCELLYLPASFHPVARIVRREIEKSREIACDELVTRRLLDRRAYAASIVSIAAGAVGAPRPGYTLGVFDGDILEERIRRLIERPAAGLKRARLVLVAALGVLTLCAVAASGFALAARAQSGSDDEMKRAGEAYNRGDYRSAVEHLERAVTADPASIRPKLFLANALMSEFFSEHAPADSPLLAAARRQYQDVLAIDPRNGFAMQGLLSFAIRDKQLQEARDWARRLIEADPKDKIGYYTAGMIDWSIVYPQFVRAKQAAGVKVEEYFIPDDGVRKTLREQYLPTIDDGFRMLDAALRIDPEYDDAMAYVNLLYRLKAGMAESAAASRVFIAEADAWVTRALAAKRKHAQEPQKGAARLDAAQGAPAWPASTNLVAAPPPPPPPPPPPAALKSEPASSQPPPTPRNAAELRGTYWQVTAREGVSSGQLVEQLKQRGFQPFLFARATGAGKPQVYVFAGPYGDAESLARAKSDLEAAGFNALRQW